MNRRSGRTNGAKAVRSEDLLQEQVDERDPIAPDKRRSYKYPHRPKKVGLQIHEGLYGK